MQLCYAIQSSPVQSNPAQRNACPGKEVGALHHTTTALARVQLRHADAHALPVDSDERLGQPLVPDLAVVCLAPHGDGDVGVCGEGEGSLRWVLVTAFDFRIGISGRGGKKRKEE
jgi:hypothetical protein